MTNHRNWYSRLVGGDTERTAASKAGITTSTLNRQIAKGSLSAENVIALAKGYGESPVEALATTGFIAIEDATGEAGEIVQLLTDQQLIRELARRIDDSPGAWTSTFDETLRDSHLKLQAVDDDAIIDRINAGHEPIAAQKRTDPLDEHFT